MARENEDDAGLVFHSIHYWCCGDNWMLSFLSVSIMHMNFLMFIVFLRFCDSIYEHWTILKSKGNEVPENWSALLEYILLVHTPGFKVLMQMLKWQVERGVIVSAHSPWNDIPWIISLPVRKRAIWYFDKEEFINTRENLDLRQKKSLQEGAGTSQTKMSGGKRSQYWTTLLKNLMMWVLVAEKAE